MNNHQLPADTFVAIDVEYADRERQNICQIGVAVVRNREITEQAQWLIQPPDNVYDEATMRVHHLTPADTENAPSLDDLWQEIQPVLLIGELWAHNATSTEQPVIEKNMRYIGADPSWLCIRDSRDLFQRPDCPYNSGNTLELCCRAMGIPFDEKRHHDALYDAVMCAKILIALQQGRLPEWGGVPTSDKEMKKQQQEKLILRLGDFQEHQAKQKAGTDLTPEGKKPDLFAELTSSYAGAQPHIVDIWDEGDGIVDGKEFIDLSRFDPSSKPLSGKSVAYTGAFHIRRTEIKRAVEALGGVNVDVKADTSIVLIGERNVGLPKLVKIEKRWQKGDAPLLVIGDADLDALLYGDGHKFFEGL